MRSAGGWARAGGGVEDGVHAGGHVGPVGALHARGGGGGGQRVGTDGVQLAACQRAPVYAAPRCVSATAAATARRSPGGFFGMVLSTHAGDGTEEGRDQVPFSRHASNVGDLSLRSAGPMQSW